MPTADLAAQRALLKLADTDRVADAESHRREALPEIAVIDGSAQRLADLRGQVALAAAEVGDIDLAIRKLDAEIDTVRQRAARDEELLASGGASPKEMENLQREVESLARRQAALEDDALELMERREAAETQHVTVQREATQLGDDVDAATVRRNDIWADIDAELQRLAVARAALVAEIPADVVAIYERVRAAGKIAAAALVGDRCHACGMALDRAALDEVRGAPADAVPRCPECSALLIRNP